MFCPRAKKSNLIDVSLLPQSVMFNLRQSDGETEKFSEEGSDISHLSSETRISMNVQQVTSRYHAIQSTVKVVLT